MIRVERIDHDNDDLSVVNAARVSFDKSSSYERVAFPGGQTVAASTRLQLSTRDQKLIGYLARNNHWTPFGHQRFTYDIEIDDAEIWELAEWATRDRAAGFVMERIQQLSPGTQLVRITDSIWGWARGGCPLRIMPEIHADLLRRCPVSADALLSYEQQFRASAVSAECPTTEIDGIDIGSMHQSATFRITAPIFVFRQLMRSNVGIVYNEVSRRYVDDEPQLWEPTSWRRRPDGSIKQGSGDDHPHQQKLQSVADLGARYSLEAYEQLLDSNVAPEQARTVLPQSMISSLWMTATLPALERIIGLRRHSHAQKEIQDLAEALVSEFHR